jgi:hypothetical protein
MGNCKCKVSENIDRIHQLYGDTKKYGKTTDIKSMVSNKIKNCFLFLITIPFIPLMLLVNIYKSLTHKTIKISTIVRLGNR